MTIALIAISYIFAAMIALAIYRQRRAQDRALVASIRARGPVGVVIDGVYRPVLPRPVIKLGSVREIWDAPMSTSIVDGVEYVVPLREWSP